MQTHVSGIGLANLSARLDEVRQVSACSIVLLEKRIEKAGGRADMSRRGTFGHEHQRAGTEKTLNFSILWKEPWVCSTRKNVVPQFLEKSNL